MGAEAVAMAIGAAGQVYGGYRANSEARKQGQQILNESEAQAGQMKEDTDNLISAQQTAYAKSGVLLEGSPLLVIAETRRKGLNDRNAVRAGARERAETVAREGRMKLFGSVMGGMSQMTGAAGGMGGGGGATTVNSGAGSAAGYSQSSMPSNQPRRTQYY